jgi:hypothetical protein
MTKGVAADLDPLSLERQVFFRTFSHLQVDSRRLALIRAIRLGDYTRENGESKVCRA